MIYPLLKVISYLSFARECSLMSIDARLERALVRLLRFARHLEQTERNKFLHSNLRPCKDSRTILSCTTSSLLLRPIRATQTYLNLLDNAIQHAKSPDVPGIPTSTPRPPR